MDEYQSYITKYKTQISYHDKQKDNYKKDLEGKTFRIIELESEFHKTLEENVFQMEHMQRQIEELSIQKQILESEKGQNMISIEEIVGDNNNYKVLLSELRKININLKDEKKQVTLEKNRYQIELDEIKGKLKTESIEMQCTKDRNDLEVIKIKTDNAKLLHRLESLTIEKGKQDTELSTITEARDRE